MLLQMVLYHIQKTLMEFQNLPDFKAFSLLVWFWWPRT